MQLSDILILVGGVILIVVGLKEKWKQRADQKERDRLFNEQTKEIEKVTEEIKNAKVDYEKKKLVVMEVIDGDKSKSPNDGES